MHVLSRIMNSPPHCFFLCPEHEGDRALRNVGVPHYVETYPWDPHLHSLWCQVSHLPPLCTPLTTITTLLNASGKTASTFCKQHKKILIVQPTRTNSDLCHLHYQLNDFYNRHEKCLLRDTNWSLNKPVCASSLNGYYNETFPPIIDGNFCPPIYSRLVTVSYDFSFCRQSLIAQITVGLRCIWTTWTSLSKCHKSQQNAPLKRNFTEEIKVSGFRHRHGSNKYKGKYFQALIPSKCATISDYSLQTTSARRAVSLRVNASK